MLSGGTISLPDQRDSTKTRFYSESSDPGLMMRSPSMRKPTNAGIIEEGDDYDENVRILYYLFIITISISTHLYLYILISF